MGWLYSVLIPRCPLDDKERVRPFISFIAFSGSFRFVTDVLCCQKDIFAFIPFYSHPFCHVAWCSGYLGCCGHMSICVLEACVYNLYREPYGASTFVIHLICCHFAKLICVIDDHATNKTYATLSILSRLILIIARRCLHIGKMEVDDTMVVLCGNR
jgi:hypothetical protein